jgi:hypothetical protein
LHGEVCGRNQKKQSWKEEGGPAQGADLKNWVRSVQVVGDR